MLGLFLDNGLIDREILTKCSHLRLAFIDISENHRELWNIYSVRKSQEWLRILCLSDEIK